MGGWGEAIQLDERLLRIRIPTSVFDLTDLVDEHVDMELTRQLVFLDILTVALVTLHEIARASEQGIALQADLDRFIDDRTLKWAPLKFPHLSRLSLPALASKRCGRRTASTACALPGGFLEGRESGTALDLGRLGRTKLDR
jgi:hypothetical protein